MVRAHPLLGAVFLLCASALAHAAYGQTPQNSAVPQNYAEPIRLSVAEIQIIPIYVPPRKDPHVDHLFTRPPLAAAEAWARSHLKAVGISHRATVIIREAAVTESPLDRKGGLSGLFTREPSEKYDAQLNVVIEVRDNYDRFVGRANAIITRTQTVLEDTEPEERQEIWSKMTDDMIVDLDQELSKQIRQHLAVFVE